MRVLVTGADGFVGRHLVDRLVRDGHEVTAACRPPGPRPAELGPAWQRVRREPLELTDDASVQAIAGSAFDAVVHLAAVSSGGEARRRPVEAWAVNATGTARLVYALSDRCAAGDADPVVLLVSTGEVYGHGAPRPRPETDSPAPLTPYASAKAAAELAGLEVWRRTGLRVIIARPFQHTGVGQSPQFVVPAFVTRLRALPPGGGPVPVGNLEPVRDLLDVRDVVEAYVRLLARGVPGEAYNIARGEGVTVAEVFTRLAALLGVRAEPVPDPALLRTADLRHLVGDSTKLRLATGWRPVHTLDATLRGIVDAATD